MKLDNMLTKIGLHLDIIKHISAILESKYMIREYISRVNHRGYYVIF